MPRPPLFTSLRQLPVFLSAKPWLAGSYSDQEFRWEVFKMDLKDSWHIFLFAIQLPCKVTACISQHAHWFEELPTKTLHCEIFNKNTTQLEEEECSKLKPLLGEQCFPTSSAVVVASSRRWKKLCMEFVLWWPTVVVSEGDNRQSVWPSSSTLNTASAGKTRQFLCAGSRLVLVQLFFGQRLWRSPPERRVKSG